MNTIQKWTPVVAIIALVLSGYLFFTRTDTGKELFGAAGNMLAENNIPYVMYNGGYNSAKPIETTSTFEADGAATFNGAITANSTVTTGELTLGSGRTRTYMDSIAAGSWYDCTQNDTGATIQIIEALIGFTSGTASSSMKVALFATSTATIPATHAYTNISATSTTSIIPLTTYATSTVATTTNSFMAGRSVSGVIQVPASAYVCATIQQGELIGSCTAGTYGGSCESATSSVRGFNPFYYFRYVR